MGLSAGGSHSPSNSSSSSSFSSPLLGCPSLPGLYSEHNPSADTDTSRWLIAHDYEDEAFEILGDLEGKDSNDPYILTQHKEIVYAVQYEKRNAVPWSKLLLGKTGSAGGTKTMRRIFLGAGTQAMQQLSGINVTSYYLPTVLIESVGLENKTARLLAACNSVSYLLFSFIGIPNVERWGRRKMMMYAAAGQCFCYLMITILLRYTEIPSYPPQKVEKIASASIAFFFLYYVFFGIGWQGVPVGSSLISWSSDLIHYSGYILLRSIHSA